MTSKYNSMFWGILIILFGVSMLLNNLGFIPYADDLFGGVLFLAISLICFYLLKKNSKNWWAIIPAVFCLIFGVALLVKNFYFIPDKFMGIAFFTSLAVAFGYIYHKNRNNWWAVIPAGASITFVTILILDQYHLANNDIGGIVVFLGIGFTFLYLWTQNTAHNHLFWAKYPALGALFLALFIYLQKTDWFGPELFLPAILILTGLFIVNRGWKHK